MRAVVRCLVAFGLCLLMAPSVVMAEADDACVAELHAGDLVLVRFAPALEPASADLIDLLVVGDVSDLCGVEIDDGEGVLRFSSYPVAAGDVIRLVSSAGLDVPDDPRVTETVVWSDTDAVVRSGRFALAKGGDMIRIAAGGTLVDSVVYGKTDEVASGWTGEPVEANRVERRIFLRGTGASGPTDTDTAADWTFPRVYRQHQTDRTSGWFDVDGETRAFLCPDRCFEEVLLRVDKARTHIDLNLYDLSSKEAVDRLVAAAERGVAVRVLLHDRPVGASNAAMDRIAWAVDALTSAGAEVRTLDGLRFDVNHAKYLVVDGTWTTALSENGNHNGWAPDGREGNRGWGVSVADAGVASWMTSLFESDFGHPADAVPATGASLHPDAQPPVWGPVAAPAPDRVETLVVSGGVRVRPVVAPDHLGDPVGSPLVSALRDARAEVWTQQLNLPLDWSRPGYSTGSPLIGAALESAARGISVRGTLASAFEDLDPATPGNDRTAVTLSGTYPTVDIRLGDAPAGGLVHNKGWLVDPVSGGRNLVVVGSANGNLASQTLNREVDLFLEDPRIAAYFRDAVADDWVRAGGVEEGTAAPTPGAGLELAAPAFPAFLVTLILLFLVHRRRSFDMSSPLGPARRR